MAFDPRRVHPSVLHRTGNVARLRTASLPKNDRVYADTLLALADSQRSPEEMSEAAAVLNPMLDAREQLARRGPIEVLERLDEIARRILLASEGARSATSGMGVDLSLDSLRMALDDARIELGTISTQADGCNSD